VIVTGGSQGMGKSVAILLSSMGANVAIVARDPQKLQLAIAEISVSNIFEQSVHSSRSSFVADEMWGNFVECGTKLNIAKIHTYISRPFSSGGSKKSYR